MAFLSTILLLAGIVSGILISIFVGRGLASGDTTFYMYAVGAGVIAAALIFLYTKVAPRTEGVDSGY